MIRMPTGYTGEIYDGKEMSGKEFLMKCARAFGACIMMRDNSLDTPIPEEFKPNMYYLEKIEESLTKLKDIQSLTKDKVIDYINQEYKDKIKYSKEQIIKYNEIKDRYLKTLREVEKWQPPTEDHIELKKFAIDQLQNSIKFDCNVSYYEKEIVKPSINEWLERETKQCLKDITYYTKENENEIERTNKRNGWIKDLRDSLNFK
jgi:hypothetical protein